jgi:hypothetical protein
MQSIHRKWSWTDYVPRSFLSEKSDQTMVEPEEEEPRVMKRKSNVDWDALSSVSRQEPKRRLLPSELQPVPKTAEIQLFPSVDGDGDDAISVDSHISGVEGDPEKFATHGDYEVDRKWLKKMRRWAEGTSGADAGEALFNDGQINEDSREQPRDATSLDLAKPDYLERRGKRRTKA